MNISLLITRSIAFTVIANVLAMIGQEEATIFYESPMNSIGKIKMILADDFKDRQK